MGEGEVRGLDAWGCSAVHPFLERTKSTGVGAYASNGLSGRACSIKQGEGAGEKVQAGGQWKSATTQAMRTQYHQAQHQACGGAFLGPE